MNLNKSVFIAFSLLYSFPGGAQGLSEAKICQNLSQMEIHSHRGASDRPENMLTAFHRAVKQGADLVEMDLQFSKDNQLVVAHDAYLKPECLDKYGRVPSDKVFFRNLTVDQIKEFDCGSRVKSGQAVPGERISTLSEVLESLRFSQTTSGQDLGLNIEIKYNPTQPQFYPPRDVYIEELLRVLDQSGIETSRLMVQSFDIEILKVLRERRKDLTISPLLSNVKDGLEIARELQAELITPHVSQVSPAMLKIFRKDHVRVVPWTVNKWEEILKVIEMGVDGAITDRPDLFHHLRLKCKKMGF